MLKQRVSGTAKTFFLSLLALLIIFPSIASAQTDIYKVLQAPFYDPSSSGDGSTPIVGCSPTLTGSDSEQKTWNYFKDKGLSDEQVAGIMGNMQQESHFDPLIMQIGGKSQDPYDAGSLGWGIIQWSGNNGPRSTGDKVTSLYEASGLTDPIYELSTQLDLVWGHMQNKPPITRGDFSLDDFKKIADEKQAALYFTYHIEAGTDPGGIRETNASDILMKYRNLTGSGSSGSTDGCSSSPGSGACAVNGPVYDGQYSQEQLAQIFGNPGTADSHPDLHLVTISFLGNQTLVNPLVVPCLEAVAQEIQSDNINYDIKQFGCYRFDSDNGSSNIGLKSYHTYGAACDINWDTNPWSGDGSIRPYDMPQEYIQAFHDHGFTWGGDWHSVKDYMHFEWHGVVPQ